MANERNRRWDDRSPARWLVYAGLLVILIAFIAGRVSQRVPGSTIREAEAAPTPRALPDGIVKFHDAGEQVTCWAATRRDLYQNFAGVSCLPDQWLPSARLEADRP